MFTGGERETGGERKGGLQTMFTGGERERVDYRLCSRVGREKGWTTDYVHGWGERKVGRHTLETVFRGGERERWTIYPRDCVGEGR